MCFWNKGLVTVHTDRLWYLDSGNVSTLQTVNRSFVGEQRLLFQQIWLVFVLNLPPPFGKGKSPGLITVFNFLL